MEESKIFPVVLIMAGGSGTRFWPLSQKNHPKQFLNLLGEKSLLQQTVDRMLALADWDHIYLCTLEAHREIAQNQLPEARHWILEPIGKNTAACLMLSVAHLLKRKVPTETPMIVLPADHYVKDTGRFSALLTQACLVAKESKSLVTLGVTPTSTHTGYGYIEVDKPLPDLGEKVFSVLRFVEKPTQATAGELLGTKKCYWNSGIFIWTLESIVSAFEKWLPTPWAQLKGSSSHKEVSDIYRGLTNSPIDIAVMEHAPNVCMIEANIEWNDLGSWNALYELKSHGSKANTILSGEVASSDSKGCLVRVPPHKQIALVGVENLIIVEHGNSILIAHRDDDQKIREISRHFDN